MISPEERLQQPVIVMVMLPLSEAEYSLLYNRRAITAPGTVFGVVREVMGLKSEPYGYKTYDKKNEEDHLNERKAPS